MKASAPESGLRGEDADELCDMDASVSCELGSPRLCRPNGYVGAAVIYDSNASCDDLGVACGVTVEVWADEAAAQARSDYIQSSAHRFHDRLGYRASHEGLKRTLKRPLVPHTVRLRPSGSDAIRAAGVAGSDPATRRADPLAVL